jgi:hypothetical protein
VKSSLAAIAFLVFASCAHAQSIRTSSSGPTYNGAGASGGFGSSGPFSGGYGSGAFSSGFTSGAANSPVVWDPPREFRLLYATNDGPFVPSTFMKYEEALALGKQLLAQQEADAASSFADAAHKSMAGKVPTFQLKSRVVQDNSGKLLVCNLNGNDCHRL